MGKICVNCSKVFTGQAKKYCSRKCWKQHWHGKNTHMFGKTIPQTAKEKLSLRWKGEKNPNFGKQLSPQTKKKLSKIASKRIGERAANWRGGINSIPGRRSWISNRRNRLKRTNGGSHTFEEWQDLKKKYKFTCLRCFRKEPYILLTEDHIIPVSKGGRDDISNIQPLCQTCNSWKMVKEIDLRPLLTNNQN